MKCKVIRVSGYENFSNKLEMEINFAIELLSKGKKKVYDIKQSLPHGISTNNFGEKEEQLHALVTVLYE